LKRCFKNIAKLIKDARSSTPWSQKDIATQLGFHNQFISNVERGECSIPVNKIVATANVLKIPLHCMEAAMVEDYRRTISLYIDDQIKMSDNVINDAVDKVWV
jgi:transcriptional regulator with XRE-family HTH domain